LDDLNVSAPPPSVKIFGRVFTAKKPSEVLRQDEVPIRPQDEELSTSDDIGTIQTIGEGGGAGAAIGKEDIARAEDEFIADGFGGVDAIELVGEQLAVLGDVPDANELEAAVGDGTRGVPPP